MRRIIQGMPYLASCRSPPVTPIPNLIVTYRMLDVSHKSAGVYFFLLEN